MNYFLPSLLLVALFSCKKNDESTPNPDLGAEVVGTYLASRIGSNGQYTTVPTSTASAAMIVIQTDLAKADITVIITISGDTNRYTYSTTLTKTGNVVTMKTPASTTPTVMATVEAEKMVFTQITADGSQTVIEGTRL